MVFNWINKKLGGKQQPGDDDANDATRRGAAVATEEGKKQQEKIATAGPAAQPATEQRKPAGRAVSPAPRGTGGIEVPREKIAGRAFEIWVRKGRPCGTSEQDWLEAEVELKAEQARRLAAGPP
jgi:hypothetical protein